MPRTRFAAHRGGAALWPENSLLAFRNALGMGAALLELDVHATADGDAAVIHDATLDRTTNGAGPVATRTAAELRAVRLKARDGSFVDEGVPMLRDVIALAAPTPTTLLVEIKTPGRAIAFEGTGASAWMSPGPRYPGLERRVLDELSAGGMTDRSVVMAFNPAVVAEVRSLAPSQRTVMLLDRQVRDAGVPGDVIVRWASGAGVTVIGVHQSLADAALIDRAHHAGLGIAVFTVNDEDQMRRLMDLGVDVIISDRPDLVAKMTARSA